MSTPPVDQARQRWETRYATDGYVFGTAPNAFLAAQAARLKPGMKALCVADGEGRNGVWLAGLGLDVLSFDLSATGLAKAQKLAAARGVALTTREADIAAWQWDEARFDVVVAIFVQFAGPDLRRAMFEGMRRTLKPGGLLILQGYRPEQLACGTGGPSEAENLYTEALLRDAFGGLEWLHFASHDEHVDEGHGHVGMSALIDLVARKPGG